MFLVARQAFGAALAPKYWQFDGAVQAVVAPVVVHRVLDCVYRYTVDVGHGDHEEDSVQWLAIKLVVSYGENPIWIDGVLKHIAELPWQLSHSVPAHVAKVAQATLQAGESNLMMEIVFEAVMSRCLLV